MTADDVRPEGTGDPPSPGPRFSYSLYECRECQAMALGVRDESAELSCHGDPMEPIEATGIDHTAPSLEDLLLGVFDLPELVLDVCHFIFESGMAIVEEVTEEFDADRDTVEDYLVELADVGLIDREILDREGSGSVTVYVSRDLAETRRAELVSFLRWAGRATMVLDEANEIKEQCLDEDTERLHEAYWDVYARRRTL